MRGGYLRFQAQYLRRVRVPHPQSISQEQARELIQAFRGRDREHASQVSFDVYGVSSSDLNDGD